MGAGKGEGQRLKDYVLSPNSQDSLTEIFLWTIRNFGISQAERYVDDVLSRCAAIGAGDAHRQPCSAVFGDDLAESLHFTRCGRHYIVFTETIFEIRIIDFLHQSADIARHLQGPHP